MRLSREQLLAEAQATGFRPDILEKVFHLLALLEGFRAQPFLKERLALKGGTALNLFVFELPRLSVDIDLNYIGASDLETMQSERPKVERAVEAVCSREGMTVTRTPGEHAGGKWRLRYPSALGGTGTLEVDLNFMFRVPLWPVTLWDSRRIGSRQATAIPVLDVHELAAGKLAALLARHAGRDLFDAHLLLTKQPLDPHRLRLAFLVYGAMNRKDWRTICQDDIAFDAKELKDQLLPVVRRELLDSLGEEWGRTLVKECCAALSGVLSFTPPEKEFLDRLLDQGQIEPSLLTDDQDLAERIRKHPWLLWKAQNVRQHKGLP